MATKKKSSTSKKIEKKVKKNTKKAMKKHPFRTLFALIILLAIACCIIFVLDKKGIIEISFLHNDKQNEDNNGGNNGNGGSTTGGNTAVGEGIIYDDFQIHFLELGNKYTGDSVYIKAGNNDILIDAGSRKDSAQAIKKYIDNYVTDGKLEYVISTHAHQDHIAGFVGSTSESTKTGIFYQYEIDNLIDFSMTNATSVLYGDYQTARTYAINKGTNHYTAADCWNNTNGASRSYTLGVGMSLDILYNYYYFNDASKTEGGENNYSVCTMLNYNDKHYMLTGDLELEGENKMAEYYDGSSSEKTLPHVELFKAGHHGSKTSSNECLLSLITPEMCCVCTCAGSTEYTANYNNIFPTQAFITRIAKYTDKVYITTMYD